MDFVLPSGFQFYEVFIRFVKPSTAGTDITLRMSTDGGVTFAAAASDYAWVLYGGDTTTGALNQIDAADNEITLNQVTNGLGNSAVQTYNARILIMNAFGRSMYPCIMGSTSNVGNTNLQTFAFISGTYKFVSNINAIRFLMLAGNISSGDFTLYGIR